MQTTSERNVNPRVDAVDLGDPSEGSDFVDDASSRIQFTLLNRSWHKQT